jgi:hypothetical protein
LEGHCACKSQQQQQQQQQQHFLLSTDSDAGQQSMKAALPSAPPRLPECLQVWAGGTAGTRICWAIAPANASSSSSKQYSKQWELQLLTAY